MLLVSQGVPMILTGDEVGRTQHGNNNAYCHDDELSWFDWALVEQNADLLRFVRAAIAFRRAHPVLRRHPPDRAGRDGSGYPGRQLARRPGLAAGLVAGRPAAGGDVLRPAGRRRPRRP